MSNTSKKICLRNNSKSSQAIRLPGMSLVLKPQVMVEISESQASSREVSLLVKSGKLSLVTETAMKTYQKYQTGLNKSKIGLKNKKTKVKSKAKPNPEKNKPAEKTTASKPK